MNVISSNAVMIFLSTKSFIPGIMNTYCWIHGTFTILEYTYDSTRRLVPHPGVGQYKEGHTILEHSYYQWVPLVLAITAVSFYIPRRVGHNGSP